MHYMTEWMYKIIQYKIQTQKFIWFLGNILCIYRTVILTYFMCKCQHKSSWTCCRIIYSYILCSLRYHNSCNNACYGMRCVILSILTKVLVVILNQILKYGCKKIIFLWKCICKAESNKLINHRSAEIRPTIRLCYIKR